jgi:hypothetical protein
MSIVYGILGKDTAAIEINACWNHYFLAHNMPCSMHKYPTVPSAIVERLSEMFTYERALYIISVPLQSSIAAACDRVDTTDLPNMVINIRGVLCATFCPVSLTDTAACLEWIFSRYQVQPCRISDSIMT